MSKSLLLPRYKNKKKMMKRLNVSLLLILVAGITFAQESKFQEGIRKNLQQHITFLAADQMLGREAGGPGEETASKYIERVFSTVGIKPAFSHGYMQSFEFNDGAKIGNYNYLQSGKTKFKIDEDYYPLSYSGSQLTKAKLVKVGFGITAPENNYDDYKDLTVDDLEQRIFVIEMSSPDGVHPHSKYTEHSGIRTKIELAKKKGAWGIIFINSDKTFDEPDSKLGRDITPYDLPIVYAKGKAYEYIQNYNNTDVVEIRVDIDREEKTGKNIVGLIDNKANHYVVIGAHYDHLGFGIEGSLHRGGKKEVHNGADDNASGVALLIELARHLKENGPNKYNYVIVAFTGEEKGLLGSNYYVKNHAVKKEDVSFMINLDMVGRLDREDPVLMINGVGTAKEWNTLMTSIEQENFRITTTESGVGPSDHTSFYLDDIPVLHFFSGTHEDYHKPSDDVDKINFAGIVHIGQYIMELIIRSNSSDVLTFVKTKDENIFKAPKFTVTLGVVPDYAFNDGGMRIDGVTDGKPASTSGLTKGDIVVKLGNYSVRDMTSYMEALSKFQKGDKTTVTYKRADKEVTTDIQF